MRIVIPVFNPSQNYPPLALAKWGNTTLIGKTLAALGSSQITDVIVGSNDPDVLVEAGRHGAKVMLKEKPDLTEHFLIPGSMDILRTLPGVSVPTAVIWYGLPGLRNHFFPRLKEISFTDGITLALTVVLSKDHPCQLNEAVNLLAAGVYFPLHIDPEIPNILVSPSFCFDWPPYVNEEGMLFIRHVIASGFCFEPRPFASDCWPSDGVLQHRGYKNARLLLPLAENIHGDYILSAMTLDSRLSPLVRMYRCEINGRFFLAINAQAAQESALSVKLWRIESGDLVPLAQSGIHLDPERAHGTLNLQEGKWILFALPEKASECTLVLWLVKRDSVVGGPTNVLLPWESEKGGFIRDLNDGPISTKTRSPILGRQDFPPIHEFDSVAALFAPGKLPEQEPRISRESVTGISLGKDHPYPVKNWIDVYRQQVILKIKDATDD